MAVLRQGAPVTDLAASLGRTESDAVEFKRDGADRNALREAICALSNDLPQRGRGHLVVGVANDGTPPGVRVNDEALRSVSEFRQEGRILPQPVVSVEAAQFSGVDCIHVEVMASPSPPLRFDGVVWVRAGTTTRRATRDEERVLSERRRAADRPFDATAVAGATLADLDGELFRPAAVDGAVLEANQRSVEEQLQSVRFLSTGVPTVVGILTVGLDPRGWLPGAYLQFVRYDGGDVTAPVQDHIEISGSLIGQLQELERLLPANIHHALMEGPPLENRTVPDYPVAALREAIVNAVMHRAYDSSSAPTRIQWFADRVEIDSPGGPFGDVRPDNYDRVTDYRNPSLAAVLKDLGYVERFGRGIRLMRDALERNGNPPPAFQIETAYWGVTLFARR